MKLLLISVLVVILPLNNLVTCMDSEHTQSEPLGRAEIEQLATCLQMIRTVLPPELVRLIARYIPDNDPVMPHLLECMALTHDEIQRVIKTCLYREDNPTDTFKAAYYPRLASKIQYAWNALAGEIDKHVEALRDMRDTDAACTYITHALGKKGAMAAVENYSICQLFAYGLDVAYMCTYVRQLTLAIDRSERYLWAGKTAWEIQKSKGGECCLIVFYGFLLGLGCTTYVCSQIETGHVPEALFFSLIVFTSALMLHGVCLGSARLVQPKRHMSKKVKRVIADMITQLDVEYKEIKNLIQLAEKLQQDMV